MVQAVSYSLRYLVVQAVPFLYADLVICSRLYIVDVFGGTYAMARAFDCLRGDVCFFFLRRPSLTGYRFTSCDWLG